MSLSDIVQGIQFCLPPTVEAGKYVFHQADYCRKLKKKLQVVDEKMETLTKIRDDVNELKESDTVKMHLTDVCEDWLQRVEKLERTVEGIREEYEIKETSKCLRCFPDVRSRYKYGKLLVETAMQISALSEESKKMDNIVKSKEPRAVERIPVDKIEEETTMSQTLRRLLKRLKSRKLRRIGVWGMPGVGKTTLMGNLNNQLEGDEMFEIVIWVTVSRDWSPRKVQDEVMRRLELNVGKDESDDSVARKLHSYLERKRWLLLLDDVWEKIDLLKIGIPSSNELNTCKVVLASRDLKVCNQMDTNENIELKTLNKDEACKLLLEKVGEVSPVIRSTIVDNILEQCGNLPLAIVTVGSALRTKDIVAVWNDMLRSLHTSDMRSTELLDMYKLLRFSYDQLSNDAKNCFLYAALYPDGHDIFIDDLIECWKAEGFFEACRNFAAAHDRGRRILETLVDASMLQSTRPGHVRMHQMLRDVALKIASPNSEGPKFFVQAGVKVQQMPEDREWEQVERISFMSSNLSSLPMKPNCAELTTLFLQSNPALKVIPDSFFVKMSRLQFLDLSNTQIQLLPRSVFALSNLRGLNLSGCRHLKAFPSMTSYLYQFVPFAKQGQLENLELLDIRGTGIPCLPSEIRKFPKLRCLKVSSTNFTDYVGKAATFPQQLEELFIDVEMNDTRWNSRAQAVVDELVKLENLNALRFYFPDVACLESFSRSSSAWINRGWRAFQFNIGRHDGHSKLSVGRSSGYLRFAGGDSIPQAVQAALVHANAFDLFDHEVARDLSEFGMENMNELESCRVEACKEIEYIFVGEGNMLPSLKELCVIGLPKLQGIWRGLMPNDSLARLKLLIIRRCPSLNMVLTWSAAQQLRSLEELRVKYCSNITEIIGCEGTVKEGKVLPKLKTLILVDLPVLSCIYKEELPLFTWSALEKIQVSNCSLLRKLPLGKPNLETLTAIRGDREWWDALEWEDGILQEKFQHLYKSEE
ncbi:Disease resistance protein [Acorus calamus]|uniref:Disease resistance protein n=1 Tax=Acorus calamus TaxID=4465 RepID=A0AAV9CQB2_ACOCL|nr:Disease resistance protein [Acorus calamus]